MREPWVLALLVGALALVGHGCTPEDQPACETDEECGEGRACAAGTCVDQPCEDGDLRACMVGGVACPGTETCVDGAWGGCEAPPEVCDGIDNDCDRKADEDFAGLGDPCAFGDGECHDSGAIVCAPDGLGIICDARPSDPVDERCNGLDDDCDGSVDEGLGGGACDTGRFGVCSTGVEACIEGDTRCVPDVEPTDERCDGVDEDCDGKVDEAANGGLLAEPCYDGPAGTADLGACATGVRVCADGEFGGCADQVLPTDEICDGVDNDCNGEADDGDVECVCAAGAERACYSGPEGTAGVGVCATGTQTCADDGSRWGPCADEVVPGVELCDGEDDDCNGVIDDAAGVNELCDVGVGACAATGVRRCDLERGQVVCDAEAALPADEICNGVDDDCNGRIDDLEQVGGACEAGVGACAAGGVLSCAADGAVRCTAEPGQPADEICNGVDDDCDGQVDDVEGLGERCEVGVGRCASTGVTVCGAEGVVCGARPGPAQAEICGNRLDDDCDGEVDDDDVCGDCGNGRRDEGEGCDDGNREDGDGCSAGCAIEDGFECFDGPADTRVAIDSTDCEDYAPADVPDWVGGYGVAFVGGIVQFAGDAQRYASSYAVRTTDAAGDESDLLVAVDADGGFHEAAQPGITAIALFGRFDRLPAGDHAVRFPDGNCADNQGTIDVEFRTLDACRPLACEADADCLFADNLCIGGACVSANCGDGRRDDGEQCDDGNRANGDGCDDRCQIEDGFECFEGPDERLVDVDSVADCNIWRDVELPPWQGGYGAAYAGGAVRFGRPSRYNGNFAVRSTTEEGVVVANLGFDDEGRVREAADAASAEALFAGSFIALPHGAQAVQYPDPECSDNIGVVRVAFRSLDLCLQSCEVDDDCAGLDEICAEGVCAPRGPFCGDGEVGPDEECDDGNGAAGDGCSALCQAEPGLICAGFTFSFGATDSVPFAGLGGPAWTISDDGRTIGQANNAEPGHYASDLPISAEYVTRFEIRVEDPGEDDDIVGWTIGGGATALSDPEAPYLLFSWKQDEQDDPDVGFAPRGLRVARVDGRVDFDELWQLRGEDITEIAAGATQGDLGWIDDQTYTIEIIGDADRMRVYVDGELQFDLADVPLGDGKLGLYTASQAGFSAALVSPESLQVCRTPEPICGDGEIGQDEECDDGDDEDGDGCSAACTREPAFQCDPFTFALGEDDSVRTNQHEAPVWQSSPDGRTLTQLTNSWPAHRTTNLPVSGDYVVRFDMTVTAPDDDDIIGWSIGGGPAALSASEQPYLLFSWLQDTVRHPDTRELITGLRVYLVDGETTPQRLLYGGRTLTLLAQATTLGQTPWRNLQTYRIEIVGDSEHLEVFVDGVREFDLFDVPLGDGNLGYYVRSQLGYQVDLIAPEDIQVCLPTEDCLNGEDDNGDGAVDCDDPGCAAEPVCLAPPEICDSGVDEDGDGAVDCDDPDCVDAEVCEAIDPCAVVDRFEPNDRLDLAALIEPGSYADLAWCPDGDEGDWYAVDVCAGGRLSVTAGHTFADGNLQLSLSRLAAGQLETLFLALTSTDDETIEYLNTGADFRALLRVNGPANVYDLDVALEGCGEAREICDSGTDDDGDGLIDCFDPDCDRIPACFCAAPDPYEDDTVVPTLLVPGDRVTDMPECAANAFDTFGLYGCGDVRLVGELEFTAWPAAPGTPTRYGNYVDFNGFAGAATQDLDAILTDVQFEAPDDCEPGEVPAPLVREGRSLRIAGVIDGDDPRVEARCGEPAEVSYQVLRITNDGAADRVVDISAHFRDAPGSLMIFDEPFDGPVLLDECPPAPTIGYRGVLMPPGTTLSVVVFNTAADVGSNQFVLRVGPPAPAIERCANGADDDGDGDIDCADEDCAEQPLCAVAGAEICNSGFDDNGDGNADCSDRLCADDPLCVEPAVCPGGDRYGPLVFGEPTLLGAGRFDGLITCEDFDLFATRLCAGGQLIVTATGDGPLNLAAGSRDPNVLPSVNDRVEAGGTARVELHNDDIVQRVVQIFVSDPTAQPGLAFDLDVRIDGCEPLSRFEVCDNRIDDDGDGAVDCDDPACAAAAACIAEICDSGIDEDGDNWIGCNDPECRAHPACTLADQVYFSVPAADGAERPEAPTTIYALGDTGLPEQVAVIPSPDVSPDGIGALAHDGQTLWGFVLEFGPASLLGTSIGRIDLEQETIAIDGLLRGRMIVGAAFNSLGELWMLDRLNQELVVAVGLEIDAARSLPLPAFFIEGDIAFVDADSTRFVLTTSDGGPPLMFRGETASGAIEQIYGDEPLHLTAGNGLAYGRHRDRCAPGLYAVDAEQSMLDLLDLANFGVLTPTHEDPLPGFSGSISVDGASGPQVHYARVVPGCEGIFEFCSGPGEDRDGLDGCEDPDCLAADPFCVE